MNGRSWRFHLLAVVAALLVLFLYLAYAVPARALECPTPQPLAGRGIMKETPAQIAETGRSLAAPNLDERLAGIVSGLRTRHAGVENAELVNYLVTAYCPIVAAESGASDAEKQARVDRFAGRLTALLY